MERVIAMLPKTIATALAKVPSDLLKDVEEIRIRVTRPLEISKRNRPMILPYMVTEEDGIQFLNKISQFSIYTLEEELQKGYVTIAGGHRVGLSGKVILEHGQVKAIRDISSFNLRIAREKLGASDRILPYLWQNRLLHTMIIGPPQTGKTTLLRDIARVLSTGREDFEAIKVGIVDERSELAGSVKGIPQLTFGPRLDVLDACPKAEGMMMMIRSMSPDVLVVDEIGRKEDGEAIQEAVHAGITIITSTHGYSFHDVAERPIMAPILKSKIFKRFIELGRSNGPGTVVSIKDEHGNEIARKVGVI